MKKLDVGSIVIFKHDHFPAKKDQAGVVISIQNKIYRIRFDWIERNKVSEIDFHELGMIRYFK